MKSSNEDDIICLERVGELKMGIWEKEKKVLNSMYDIPF